MSLPIALGAKSVSSRPLVMSDRDDLEEEHEFFAEDEITPLDPVLVQGAPLTAMTVCPKQEWQATVSIQYYDMMMAVDDDDDDNGKGNGKVGQKKSDDSGLLRRARHSTIAEVRIQISPLSLPFSSRHRDVLHRLELPHLPLTPHSKKDHRHHHHQHGQKQRQPQRYSDDEHLAHHAPVQPCLVFSSDRRNLACLVPHPRGYQSSLVSIPLKRPTPQHAPPPRPAIPSYIPTSSNPVPQSSTIGFVPEASGEPQWLCLPAHAALDIRQNALFWLHSITSLCDSSTQTKRITARGSSVLLAGCRDGSILGISFSPLLLAGILFHPTQGKEDGAVTCLSHMTTSRTSSNDGHASSESGVLGKLVAIRESGKAHIFQTRMVLSSLDSNNEENDDNGPNNNSALLDDMDATDYSASDYAAGTTGVMLIHPESFHVVKTGRRNSLPANARLALNEQDKHNMQTHHVDLSGTPWIHKQDDNSPVGATGLLMLLEPLSEFMDNICRAQWITGSLLAVLAKPANSSSHSESDDSKNLVARVLGVSADRPPESLSDLHLTHEDLHELAHTTFSLEEEMPCQRETSTKSNAAQRRVFTGNTSNLLEASLGIHYDAFSGCLAISSARIIKATNSQESKSEAKKRATFKKHEFKLFVCLWQWRPNVVGFTAVATKMVGTHHNRPISKLFFAKNKFSNARQIAHIHSSGGDEGSDRIRKDLYEVGLLSPPQDLLSGSGWGVKEPSPVLLSSNAVTFAFVTEPTSDASEVEWQECALPISYRLGYGAPLIASMGSKGRSIAIASSRGLCVLECSPKSKKLEEKERSYLSSEFLHTAPKQDSKVGTRKNHAALYTLPPRWHMFGNEMEESSFRVLTMTWWEGMGTPHVDPHMCDDLLVTVIQLQSNGDVTQDSLGPFYLACWSQRTLDAAHQRLRPLDDDLHATNRQWGVRLPNGFRPKSVKLIAQPYRSDAVDHKQSIKKRARERKAVLLLTSDQGQGSVEFLLYQLQTIASMKTQKPDSYVEQNPYSVLSRCCSTGEIPEGIAGSSISNIFLASASFQFDLVRQTSKVNAYRPTNGGGSQVNEIIGTVGVFRSPGCGLDAIVITSAGLSKVISVCNFHENGSTMIQVEKAMKSSDVSSFWLSDVVRGTRSISTNYGENALVDMYVWTIQMSDGELFCWFVPCLEFHTFPSQSADESNDSETPNVFSSRVMFGSVCPIGSSSTWMQQSSAKTGRDFVVGCIPHSSHGCFLSTGQGSRKFHRTIAGDFDDTLFTTDFMEHEFLYPSDIGLSPPAFMSCIAALIHIGTFLFLSKLNDTAIDTPSGRHLVNAGGKDMESGFLAIDICDHIRRLSQVHQDAAFMALRLLILRSVEQLAEDPNKKDKGRKSHKSAKFTTFVLSEVLQVVRSCTSSRLQFASLLLEVGRQLEPSCFPHLFPLPIPENGHNGAPPPIGMLRSKEKIKLRTVVDFFNACVEDGSVLVSVSSLPIIRKKDVSRQNSILILDHCLRALVENTKSESNLLFDFSATERSTLSDVFRFGVKLEDAGTDEFAESSNETAGDVVYASDSEDDDDGNNKRKGYGITCGIFNIFGRNSDPAAKKINIRRGSSTRSSTVQRSWTAAEFESFAGAVATVLVQLVFPGDSSQPTRTHVWKRSTTIAYLLLGPNKSSLPCLSAKECTRLAKSTLGAGLPGNKKGANSVEERIATLLTRSIVACRDEITAREAGRIVDLVLVLLSRCRMSSELDSTIPGLLIVGISAAHVCGRIDEILDTKDGPVPIHKAFLTAKERTANMGSC